MQQPKEQSSIRQKLESIFGLGSSRASPLPQKSYDDLVRQDSTFFTDDVLRELEPGVPTAQRVRAMKELHEIVSCKRLEKHAVQVVWQAIKDLVEPGQPVEVRHATLVFTQALIRGQFDELGMMRAHFLHVVQNHSVMEDAQHRLEIVRVLTKDGRNIQYIEDTIGPFLLEWMPEAITLTRAEDFMTLLVNLVHYNAAYLDQGVLVGLVQLTCVLANRTTQPALTELSLSLLSAVVCYSRLPVDSLQPFVTALCHTLNVERFSHRSLEVMLRLLGTHLGQSAVYTMCSLIQERCGGQDALLLRGAVFYISMCMWGVKRVENLDLPFSSVLPSIKQAVLSNHTLVVYEVALSLKRLVRIFSSQLHPLDWALIYDILEAIQKHLVELRKVKGEATNSLVVCLHDIITTIQESHEQGKYIGSPEQFFSLVEGGMDMLPLSSVLLLVAHQTTMIDCCQTGWIEQLASFMDKFYRKDRRTAVRTAALNHLGAVLAHNMAYESELMEEVVLPLLGSVAEDRDVDVRCRAVQLLVHLAGEATPEWMTKILAIINTVFLKGLETAASQKSSEEELKLPDSKAAVFGLTLLLKSGLSSSSPLVAHVFSLLLSLVLLQYKQHCHLSTASVMRMNTFNCVLSLRSNERGQLGYVENGSIQFSPFYVCTRPEGYDSEEKGMTFSPTLLDLPLMFNAVLECLKHECECEVLLQVLLQLKDLLQDRTLVLAAMPDLSPLAIELSNLVDEQSTRLQQLHNVSSSWSTSDLIGHVYPALANLCTYPSHLDRRAQQVLVIGLEGGLVGKSAQTCISALALCSLELQATMTRLLPHILLRMGQVAATPAMALPVLQFLASICAVPSLHSGFVERQYLAVFGIALPYASPEKHTSYIMALAYRVIAMWFVQCRMQYRQNVARFILKTLATNLAFSSHPGNLSPLVGKGAVGVECAGEGVELCRELAVVCEDVMARYTYSNLSTLPSRSPGADFLISGGHSKTWLVANSLVTVTTSGLGGGVPGTCSRCALNRAHSNGGQTPASGSKEGVLCSCWCQGWAEIKVRRPAGNVSWLMRLQNQLQFPTIGGEGGNDADRSLLAANFPLEALAEDGEEGIENLHEEARGGGGRGGEEGEGEGGGGGRDIRAKERAEEEGERGRGGGEGERGGRGGEGDRGGGGGGGGGEEDQKEEREGRGGEIEEKRTREGGGEKEREEGRRVDEKSSVEVAVNQQSRTTPDKMEPVDLSIVDEEADDDQVFDGVVDSKAPEECYDRDMKKEKITKSPDKEERAMEWTRLHRRQPSSRRLSSQSWSEERDSEPHPLSASSYCSLEHFPPLLSYDWGDGVSRSPSLHGIAGLLSEQEQIHMVASLSEDSVRSSSDESSDDTPAVSGDAMSLSTSEESSAENEGEKGEGSRKLPNSDSASPRPRLKHQSLSMPEETNGVDSVTPSDGQTPPSRRKSVPLSPFSTNASSPASNRKRLIFTKKASSLVSSHPHQSEENMSLNNPSFIFLQFYHSSCFHGNQGLTDTPILLPGGEAMERAMKVLDRIPPYDTHKIGVVYVDKGQSSEQDILSNTFGSARYVEFLRGLGLLVALEDCLPEATYLGGLDRSGSDGRFTYIYHDSITQVVYHVATLMPTVPADPHCSDKKRHIGNDFVHIVYNNSSLPYSFGTVKGQFNFAEVVIEPLAGSVNRVTVRAKKDLEDMVGSAPCLVSDKWLPVLVRQRAIQANMASLVHVGASLSTEHCLSNWLGRLRQIRRIRDKCSSRHSEAAPPSRGGGSQSSTPKRVTTSSLSSTLLDFTQYT